MAEIWTRATRQRQSQGAARLSYPASFVFNGIGGGPSPAFTDARPGSSQSGTTVVITGSSLGARADFTLATPPPITGALPWTLVALQYWPSTPTSTGIIGLRVGSGPTFCIWSGQLNFYTNSAFVPSGISASAGLHCVALSHDGNGNGIYYYDGQTANVTGLGATGSAVTALELMNWDATSANYSPGVGAYVAFAAVIDTKVPDGVMRRVTGDKNPWQLFAPERRVTYFFTSGGTTVNATGVSATGAVGTVTATGASTYTATGVSATGAVGTVTATGASTYTATGVSATGDVGTVTATGASTYTASGVSATGDVGTVTVSTTNAVTVNVTGVSATGDVGTVTATGASTYTASGVSATGDVGTVTVTGASTYTATGVTGTGAVGTVTVVTDPSITVFVSGVFATGFVGTVNVWSTINDNQTPNWQASSTNQTPAWGPVSNVQSANWQ